jgi:hypothetical protein
VQPLVYYESDASALAASSTTAAPRPRRGRARRRRDLARAAGGLLGIRAGVRRAFALCGARGSRGGTTTRRFASNGRDEDDVQKLRVVPYKNSSSVS